MSKIADHPFFDFKEPEDARECAKDIRRQLDDLCRTLVVDMKGDDDTLDVEWDERETLPLQTDFGHRRAVNLMKRFPNDADLIDDCSAILAHLCGDCTRPQIGIRVRFICAPKVDEEFHVYLPDFADGDVGFRIWGACMLLARLILDNEIVVSGRTVVELGAASGLCGLAAARRGASNIYLTDFNDACIKAAGMNASIECSRTPTVEISAQFLDWNLGLDNSMIQWKDSILLGAAVVYEPIHGELLSHFLGIAFNAGASCAIIAIHKEHSGFQSFTSILREQFDFQLFCSSTVIEDIGLSPVAVFKIVGLKLNN